MTDNVFAFPCERVKFTDSVYLIAKELHTNCEFIIIGQVNVHNIPADAELVANEIYIISFILQFNQTCAELITIHLHSRAQTDDHAAVINGIAQRVNAGDTRHNNHVAAFRKCRRSGMAETVNLIIDCAVFFNIGICRRNIGLRLIIVVVADEILHRIVREKAAHLSTDLAGQCFVWFQNKGRTVASGNDVCHGESFAGAGNAEKRLCLIPGLQSFYQRINRLRLVSGGLKRCFEMKHFFLMIFLFWHSIFPHSSRQSFSQRKIVLTTLCCFQYTTNTKQSKVLPLYFLLGPVYFSFLNVRSPTRQSP